MGEIQKNDKQLSMDFSAESVGNTEKEEKKEVKIEEKNNN